MPANSLNLVDLIREHLSGSFVSKTSSFLGESDDRTRTGLRLAVPILLAGLARAASTSEGHRRIASAVNDANDEMLDSPQGLFGSLSSESGSGILRSIFGGGTFSEMNNNLGRSSGISSRGAGSLMGLLAPLVFGVIKRVMRNAPDRYDVAGLLSSQSSNIAAALPEGYTDETYAGPRVASGRWGEGREPTPHTRSNWSWILPLALLLLGLGLIWNWGSRRRDRAFAPPATVHAGREDAKPMVTLDSLKTKYKSVLDEARSQGIQVSDLREKNGKLMITGTAPSQDAVNKVWDQIKRINPSHNDIAMDLRVAPTGSPLSREKPSAAVMPNEQTTDHQAIAPEPLTQEKAGEPVTQEKPSEPLTREKAGTPADTGKSDESVTTESKESSGNTYIVKPGDTLTSISKRFYGTGKDFRLIVEANRKTIGHKDMIRVGQELMIPSK